MKNMRLIIFALTLLLSSIQITHGLNIRQSETNKQIVMSFYDKIINQKDFDAASQYLDPNYKQHDPNLTDGLDGLNAFIQFLRKNYPNAHSEIKRVFSDGDYVVLHVHSNREPGTRGRAIFDLFKLNNGKIVEHWDTIQDIPEKSANNNGMF